MSPKKIDVMKKVFARLSPVYIMNNGDNDAPTRDEYTQNNAFAVSDFILFIRKDMKKTIPKVMSERKNDILLMNDRISGDDIQIIETPPVKQRAMNIFVKTPRI